MRAWSAAVLGFVLVVAGCKLPDANSDLRMRLRTRVIDEVLVFYIPEDVQFAVAPSPESLEQQAHVKLRIGGSALMDLAPDLDDALSRTRCRESGGLHEARTGVIFYADGKKLASFYYGPAGRGGQIDDAPCVLTPSLYYWARQQLPRTD